MPDAFKCIILFLNWSIPKKMTFSLYTDEKIEAVSSESELGSGFSVPTGIQELWNDWISLTLKNVFLILRVFFMFLFPVLSTIWCSFKWGIRHVGSCLGIHPYEVFLGFDRKKKGLQTDWVLQKGVESSHGICLIFLKRISGKFGRSNYHVITTATHLQKPLKCLKFTPWWWRKGSSAPVPWQVERMICKSELMKQITVVNNCY